MTGYEMLTVESDRINGVRAAIWVGRISRLCYVTRTTNSRQAGQQSTVRHHQRYQMRVAARRIRLKIHNLIDEVHKRLAKWLCCENYRCVLLPEFKSSEMV